MKTAMQELLEWHRKSMRSYSETNKMIESFLQKDKEQIQKSYKDHHDLGHIYGLDIEEYYNQTYNQNK